MCPLLNCRLTPVKKSPRGIAQALRPRLEAPSEANDTRVHRGGVERRIAAVVDIKETAGSERTH